MRTVLYLIRKEFIQIFRNKFISKAIFAVPIVQMLILVPAVTFEIKNVNLSVIDMDMTDESRGLISKFKVLHFSEYHLLLFQKKRQTDLLYRDKCSVILNIPSGFGKDIVNGKSGAVQATINAINASTAQLSWAYLNGVIRDYNVDLATENINSCKNLLQPRIEMTNRYWYNETLNYKYYMLPGILAILVTAIGFLLAGLIW